MWEEEVVGDTSRAASDFGPARGLYREGAATLCLNGQAQSIVARNFVHCCQWCNLAHTFTSTPFEATLGFLLGRLLIPELLVLDRIRLLCTRGSINHNRDHVRPSLRSIHLRR